LQYEISERDSTIDWSVNSRSIAWDREAKAQARVVELIAALDSLQVYYNTLHEVHVLYARLHLNVPSNVAAMGADHWEQQLKDLMRSWTFLGPLLP
jgi:allophanate hydrolase subunit 1